MTLTTILKNIDKATLPAGVLIIWYYVVVAHTAPYDENYGYIISAVVVSSILTAIMVLLWFLKREIVKESKLISVFFIVSVSPVAIGLYIELYQILVGQYFKAG